MPIRINDSLDFSNLLDMEPTLTPWLFGLLGFKVIFDFLQTRESNKQVNKAEDEAFNVNSNEKSQVDGDNLVVTQEKLKLEAEQVKKLINDSKSAIEMGRLFNLYNKQIERYQTETRTRASWSFIFAILSMFLGMFFIFWGGSVIISEDGSDKVLAGSAIASIGGAISAYITKTFLDVHKLSVTQLNRYFKQPVINDHIIMAQRLADGSKDDVVRKEAYQKIISSVCDQMRANSTENQ